MPFNIIYYSYNKIIVELNGHLHASLCRRIVDMNGGCAHPGGIQIAPCTMYISCEGTEMRLDSVILYDNHVAQL